MSVHSDEYPGRLSLKLKMSVSWYDLVSFHASIFRPLPPEFHKDSSGSEVWQETMGQAHFYENR